MIPKWFGRLSSKYKTPSNAIIFVFIIACVAPFFGRTALGWIVDMSSLGAAIGYGYTSAATFYFLKKDGEKNRLLSFTSILGVAFAIVFAVLLLVPIKMFNCSLGKESWICLIAWIVIGVVFYFGSRRKKQQQISQADE